MALAAALPSAGPTELPIIVQILLRREDHAGQSALVTSFHLLPPDAQELVILEYARLYRALADAMAQKGTAGPINGLTIIARARSARLAYLVSDQLRSSEPQVRQMAADTLLGLASWASDRNRAEPPGPDRDGPAVEAISRAVAEGVATYPQHRQQAVLLALLALAGSTRPATWRLLTNPRQPAVAMLRAFIDANTDALAQRALPIVIRQRAFTAMAVAVIDRLRPGKGLEELLEQTHLFVNPLAAGHLRKLDAVVSRAFTDDQLDTLSSTQARGLPRWIMLLPLESAQQVEPLARCNRLSDPLARVAALRALFALASDPSVPGTASGANAAISSFCRDSQPEIARLALRHLARCRWEDLPRLLADLITSSDESVRALAGKYLAAVGFDRLWAAWPRLDELQRLAAGRALIKIDPNFHQQLALRLASAQRPDRLRAMAMIHGLNQGLLFEPTFLALASDRDVVIAASALRVLGSVDSPRALAAIEAALDHPDSRVRANAVEALQQLRSYRRIDKLLRMADDDDNRPRANAIAALMEIRTADALVALAAMLADRRPRQRISGLWLVESLGLFNVARQVAEISLADPDPNVKTRARQVIERMLLTHATANTSAPASAAGNPALAAADLATENTSN